MRAYVLAGGASRRMGQDKALLEHGGVPMAVHLAGLLRAAGFEASVVRRRGQVWPFATRVVWESAVGPRHPLCGVLTALHDAQDGVVVIPCDLPHLTAEALRLLASPGVAYGERIHPLVAQVPWSLREAVARGIRTGASARSVLGSLPAIAFPAEQLYDRNT